MTGDDVLLIVDGGRCIGCRACSQVSLPGTIVIEEVGAERSITFPAFCEEDWGEKAAEACPVGAISLGSGVAIGERFTLSFGLVSCQRCGAPFATEGEMGWLKATIPQGLQTDAAGRSWVELCPSCRRQVERERAARDVAIARGGARR